MGLPLLRRLFRDRYAPYLILVVLSAMSPALPHAMTPNGAYWAAAWGVIAVMVLVGWLGHVGPEGNWCQRLAPLLVLPAIVLLRDADGNSLSGFSPLIFVPVIWFALYGRRRELLLALLGSTLVLVLPLVVVGAPQYPHAGWRGTVLLLIIAATLGPLVQGLVGNARTSAAALTASEKRFRDAFDDAPTGTMLSSVPGDGPRQILQVNRAFCALLGRPATDIIGHDLLEFTHPDDVITTLERRALQLDPRRPRTIEKRLLHRSGRTVWVRISFSVILDGAGVPLHVIAQFEDIGARRESDEAMLAALETERAAAEELRAAEQSRRDLVSSVSHDLRTPITAAAGFAELLGEGDAGPLNDEQQSMLATVTRNLARLSAIVDDLLALSRTDAERRSRAVPVDIGSVVEGVVQGVTIMASTRGQQLRYVNELTGVIVRGDATRLDRALSNLLSNAVKFTPAEGSISVRAIREDDRAVISIADTGIGIPADDLDQVFGRYYRSKQVRDETIAGTGLGLAIVEAITSQHGGTIEVASEVGAGTTFTLSLPIADHVG